MFVSLEGIDGSGKSTQAALLVERLAELGLDVVATREPGSTALGEEVRRLLLGPAQVDPWAEAALFASARAQLVAEVIGPALAAGRWVVCDRYIDSSLAYQGVARGLGVDKVLALNEPALSDTLPDRTFVLDVLPEAVTARSAQSPADRIEGEGRAFQAAVAQGYRELVERFPDRISLVPGDLPQSEVAERIEVELGVASPGGRSGR
jgi:dTMP kinase